MFNFNKNKEEKKEEKVCFTCGCFFKNGKTVPREGIFTDSQIDYCLKCSPNYDKCVYDTGRQEYFYVKNNVECDENGIPLIGLEKPKSK